MNNQWFSKVAVWLVIALVLFTVFKQFDRGVTQGNQIGYSDFLEEVRSKRIKSVTLQESPGGGTEIIAAHQRRQAPAQHRHLPRPRPGRRPHQQRRQVRRQAARRAVAS